MPTVGENLEKIRGIIVEYLHVEPDKVMPDVDIEKGLEADSVDIMEIILRIQDESGIEIGDDDVEKLRTPQLIAVYITAHQK